MVLIMNWSVHIYYISTTFWINKELSKINYYPKFLKCLTVVQLGKPQLSHTLHSARYCRIFQKIFNTFYYVM